jgi:hypothetical protein
MLAAMRLILLLALATACGGTPPPAPAASPPPPSANAPPAETAAPAQPEPPPSRPLPDVQILNLCHDVALLAYGTPPNMKEDALGRFPGDGGEGKAPRERDGTLQVTLVDAKGSVLAEVQVTRRMKKVEIGRSCRTLYAH